MILNLPYSTESELQTDDPRRVAVHEAGHAIIAVKLGVLFEYAELGPGPEDGQVSPIFSPFDKDSRPDSADIPKWRLFYAGGAAAEYIAFNSIRRHAIRCDVNHHADLNRICEDKTHASFEASIVLATGQLSVREIYAVADALERTRKLSYDDVCSIVGVTPPW